MGCLLSFYDIKQICMSLILIYLAKNDVIRSFLAIAIFDSLTFKAKIIALFLPAKNLSIILQTYCTPPAALTLLRDLFAT